VRLIITGSSGQIGTNLALRCLALGHAVLGIDCRPNPWTASVPTIIADLRQSCPISLLCTGASSMGKTWNAADVVVHLAAHAKVHDLVETPRRALENVQMTQHVLDLCRSLQSPIVFASSREIYGDVVRAVSHETEARLDHAASPYAASKIAGEALVQAYSRCYGIPHLVLRLSNVYGRCDNDVERLPRVIPLFMRQIRNGKPVTVFGADKILDFTFIDDCIEGVILGIERLRSGDTHNETINLAYGKGRSLLEVAAIIGRELDRRPSITVLPKRRGEITRYVASLDKARALLGFEPKVSLEEGIRRAIAWQQARMCA